MSCRHIAFLLILSVSPAKAQEQLNIERLVAVEIGQCSIQRIVLTTEVATLKTRIKELEAQLPKKPD